MNMSYKMSCVLEYINNNNKDVPEIHFAALLN